MKERECSQPYAEAEQCYAGTVNNLKGGGGEADVRRIVAHGSFFSSFL